MPEAPRTYVLIHGAWHGGWVWKDVADALRAEGHQVNSLTLTGLGEREHLLTPEVGLDTHTDDVVNHIEMVCVGSGCCIQHHAGARLCGARAL